MPIDFDFAQTRAQARLGQRLSEQDWLRLESAAELSQYLLLARDSALAPLVRHFSSRSIPHDIEQSLRADWRADVRNIATWVPHDWQAAVTAVAALPDLAVLEHIDDTGEVPNWIVGDGSFDEAAPRRAASSSQSRFARWFEDWQRTCPADAGVSALVERLAKYRAKQAETDGTRPVEAVHRQLATDVLRQLRQRSRQPVVVFCLLVLLALDLHRLRGDLVQRAIGVPVPSERAA